MRYMYINEYILMNIKDYNDYIVPTRQKQVMHILSGKTFSVNDMTLKSQLCIHLTGKLHYINV